MKAILLEEFGGVENLKVSQAAKQKPKADEIQIEIHYAAVNPVDWKIREGLLKNRMPYHLPLIPGWDAAGVVSAVGKEVTKFKAGDEVFAYCKKAPIQFGTYAEYICVPESFVAFKPKKLSFAQSSAIPLAGLTAWQALFDTAKLTKGEKVLIHAGAGGVGSLAIQFAKAHGVYVYTTASEPNHSYVKSLGADVIIDYKKQHFVDAMHEINAEGVDVVFDTVGGQTYKESFKILKPGGRIVSLLEQPDEKLASKAKVEAMYVFVQPDGVELEKIAKLADSGKLKSLKITEFPLEKAGEAQEKNRLGEVDGKIVLRIKD